MTVRGAASILSPATASPGRPSPARPGRWPGRAGGTAALVVFALLSMSGCATTGVGGGREGIAEVHLFAAPAALNLDSKPGPDAIGVRIYASGPTAARGVPILKGALEVLMFDGSVGEAALRSAKPAKTWTFSPAELRTFASETSLGVGYQLALSWGQSPPKEPAVTVFARYRNSAGRELLSAPNTIFVATRKN